MTNDCADNHLCGVTADHVDDRDPFGLARCQAAENRQMQGLQVL